MTPTSPFHAAARGLAERGCAVLPCYPRAKRPRIAEWQNTATTDVTCIDTWWTADPQCNVGLATGRKSGLIVIDVEMKNGLNGEADLRKLEEERGPLPATVEVITPNGPGRHIYLRTDRKIRGSYIAEGIEIKADGNQVLAPPSIHPDTGTAYQWSVDCAAQIADAPEWLLDMAAVKTNGNGKVAAAPAEYWHALVAAGVDEGQRNVSATKLAGHLLRRFLDPYVVLELVRLWNDARCRPPLETEVIKGIVASLHRKEMKRRGRV